MRLHSNNTKMKIKKGLPSFTRRDWLIMFGLLSLSLSPSLSHLVYPTNNQITFYCVDCMHNTHSNTQYTIRSAFNKYIIVKLVNLQYQRFHGNSLLFSLPLQFQAYIGILSNFCFGCGCHCIALPSLFFLFLLLVTLPPTSSLFLFLSLSVPTIISVPHRYLCRFSPCLV